MSAAPAKNFRAGLVQLRSGRSVAANLDQAETLIRRAAQGGAVYVQTPENTAFMELEPKLVLAAAEPEQASVPLKQSARARRRARHFSPYRLARHQARRDAPSPTALISSIPPAGSPRSTTSCICSTSTSPAARAIASPTMRALAARRCSPIFHSAGSGCRSATICAFPQLYRALAAAGAEFIAVPAAFTKQTGEAHWHVLIRARAIETGAFVLAATQGGLHENGRSTFGHSLIVSPWGEVLAEGGEDAGRDLRRYRPCRLGPGPRPHPGAQA